LVAGGLLVATVAAAQTAAPEAAPNRELVVGVFEAPPYSLKGPSGEWRGLTVDLWKEVATDLGLRYRLVEKNEDAILEELADGRLDLAVGPFAVTMERERVIDFTHRYLNTGLSVAVRQRSRMERVVNLFRSLASSGAAHLLGAIVILSAVFGGALWLTERRHNPQFPARPAPGIGSGLWWAGVTTSGVGYGDKVPVTVRGRLLAIVWMLVSLVLYVLVTAGLTATLAVAEFERAPSWESLRHTVVGALGGSAAADYLRLNRVSRRLYPEYRGVLQALAERKVDAVMLNEEVLRYYAARTEGARLEILPQIYLAQDFAFPLPDASSLRQPLNQALRRALAGTRYRDLKDGYLGGGDTAAGGP
jgi:ABC-type amino acid transport substrate-binding protein